MKSTIKLTPEKFQEIYSNEEFRNQVAYAHQQCDKNSKFMHFITCSYPVTYIVTPEQIAEATKEVERRTKEVIKANKNKLMFVGMGCTYTARYENDVCNHRIRTEFKNANGRHFFIEVGTWGEENMRVDFSIDRDLENEYSKELDLIHNKMDGVKKYSNAWHELNEKREKYMKQPFYNYNNLERGQTKENSIKYTLQNVLEFVNKHFECNFKEIVIDNYNVSTDDYISISPAK